MKQTTDFNVVKEWCDQTKKDFRIFQTWIPRSEFESAVLHEDSISVFRGGSEKYGIALGENPWIDPSVETFSIPRSARDLRIPKLGSDFEAKHEWDAYIVSRESFIKRDIKLKFKLFSAKENEHLMSEINDFLHAQAPDSSVQFGNPEVVSWFGFADGNEIVATAALCRWQSNQLVISSVAVHRNYRNQGLAKDITSLATHFGLSLEPFIALGVFASNHPAKRAYETLGYSNVGEFASFKKRKYFNLLEKSLCCDTPNN